MKKYLISAALTMCLISPLFANYIKDDLNKSTGARAAGMSGAFTAVADDYSAFFWNPAGLVLAERVNLNVFFDSAFKGSQYNYGMNYTHPFLPDMTASATYIKTVFMNSNFYSDLFFLNYATYLNEERVSAFGAGLKFINISMRDYELSGFTPAIDMGFMLFPPAFEGKLKIGMAAQDLDAVIKWSNGVQEVVPAHYKMGASYSFDPASSMGLDVRMIDYRIKGVHPRMGFSIGGEKWFLNRVFGNFGFRGGFSWREGVNPNHGLSFGASYGRREFVLNYVYLPGFAGLGETHKIDFSYYIGERVKDDIKRREPVAEIRDDDMELLAAQFKNIRFDISRRHISPGKEGLYGSVNFVVRQAPAAFKNMRWKIEIFDSSEKPVMSFGGADEFPETVLWNGTDSSGRPVSDGDYTARFTVIYGRTVLASAVRTIIADTVPPRFRLAVEPKIFAPHPASAVRRMSLLIMPVHRDVESWRLNIKTGEGTIIRRFSGEGLMEKLAWDGDDALGNVVKDGKYDASMELKDFAGNVYEVSEGFEVDTVMAAFNAEPDTRILKTGAGVINFVSNMRDINRIKSWGIDIRDSGGKLVKSVQNRGPGVRSIPWDGTGEGNRYVKSGSVYTYQMTAEQKNSILIKREGLFLTGLPEFEGTGIELTLAVVDFKQGSSSIPVEEYGYINQAAEAVNKYAKNYQLVIKGYATDLGAPAENFMLSIERARAVRDYLVNDMKLDPANVYITGYGDGILLGIVNRDEIIKNGRRVEIELLTK